jgi:hypothetical protein
LIELCFFGDSLLLLGESFSLPGDLIGELSLISFPIKVFYIATFSENFLRGSFLSNFSNS